MRMEPTPVRRRQCPADGNQYFFTRGLILGREEKLLQHRHCERNLSVVVGASQCVYPISQNDDGGCAIRQMARLQVCARVGLKSRIIALFWILSSDNNADISCSSGQPVRKICDNL